VTRVFKLTVSLFWYSLNIITDDLITYLRFGAYILYYLVVLFLYPTNIITLPRSINLSCLPVAGSDLGLT
jgi:hypothetical protein